MKNCYKITVGARSSPLSKAQVDEVLKEIQVFHPTFEFIPIFIKTIGDNDRTTSLRTLDKTDFFTKEIDEMLLAGVCRIAIHSAKDLPDPLPKGLMCVALTKGVDSSDVLVLKEEVDFDDLPSGALIATSSTRREENVRRLRNDLKFIDIRGTIDERLAMLTIGLVDGIVVAEAALIRLGLTHLNRLPLPGEVSLHQGRLAVIAQEGDREMRTRFICIDAR